MGENGPSEKAIEAAADAHERFWGSPRNRLEFQRDVLAAAHDPALGFDRSVCLRDVYDVLSNAYHPQNPTAWHPADVIERAFTEPSSPGGGHMNAGEQGSEPRRWMLRGFKHSPVEGISTTIAGVVSGPFLRDGEEVIVVEGERVGRGNEDREEVIRKLREESARSVGFAGQAAKDAYERGHVEGREYERAFRRSQIETAAGEVGSGHDEQTEDVEAVARVLWDWNAEKAGHGYPYERLIEPTKDDLRDLASRLLVVVRRFGSSVSGGGS